MDEITKYLLLRKSRGGLIAPTDVANLSLWLKSDTGVYQEHDSKTTASGNGDPVGTWEDQSGNGNDLVAAASDTTRPTLATNQLNGYPALQFDGSNDEIGASFTLTQPFTVYIVFLQDSWANAENIFNAPDSNVALFQYDGTPELSLYAGTLVALNNADLPLDTYGIVRCVFNGASSGLRVDNNTETTGDPGTGNPGGIELGVNNANNKWADFDVVEIAVYNSLVSDADDSRLIDYFDSRYNII